MSIRAKYSGEWTARLYYGWRCVIPDVVRCMQSRAAPFEACGYRDLLFKINEFTSECFTWPLLLRRIYI